MSSNSIHVAANGKISFFFISSIPHIYIYIYKFSSVQSLSCIQLFATPWITARQASLSITNFQSLLKLMSIGSLMPSSHLILCCPLLLLPSIPPSIGLFQWINYIYTHTYIYHIFFIQSSVDGRAAFLIDKWPLRNINIWSFVDHKGFPFYSACSVCSCWFLGCLLFGWLVVLQSFKKTTEKTLLAS